MKNNRDGGNAFPNSFSSDYPTEIVGGMTLRDLFAIKTYPSFLDLVLTEVWNQGQGIEGMTDSALQAAKAAYRAADAMIQARELEQE